MSCESNNPFVNCLFLTKSLLHDFVALFAKFAEKKATREEGTSF